ncbi:MaoC family dehydratase [Burkholderia cepacia]|uniref:MaoC family dehydratase n=1 Tax=Burkholderia cepacia TaxID=292 RepID=UPI002ABE5A6A|nr:MaoC family dehydratase [Burkholderia cepacia]
MTGISAGLDGIQQWIGKELGVSAWEQVDQARIDAFAHCTGDHQWIHIDQNRARRESPVGTTIAHGYLLLSLIAPTSFEVFIKPAGVSMALNYGLDKVRFLTPVPAGARVRNRITLLSVDDKGAGRTLLVTENAFEVEGETKPALVAQALTMVLR